jgi:hypothetical protein
MSRARPRAYWSQNALGGSRGRSFRAVSPCDYGNLSRFAMTLAGTARWLFFTILVNRRLIDFDF